MLQDVAIMKQIGDGTFYVEKIEITNPGFGYTSEPDIQFIGGIGDNTRIASAKSLILHKEPLVSSV